MFRREGSSRSVHLDGAVVAPNQSHCSTRKPLTLENSPTLLVTSVTSRLRAWAAINASSELIEDRFEQVRHDIERPVLSPDEAFHAPAEIRKALEHAGPTPLKK